MRKIFIDTNVLIDLLAEREPWANDAAVLFSMADRKEVELACCALSFATATYILGRLKFTRRDIVRKLTIAKSLCTLVPIDANIIDRMLQSEFEDLEDAIQYYAALSVGADCIATRNPKDFVRSALPLFLPSEIIGVQE